MKKILFISVLLLSVIIGIAIYLQTLSVGCRIDRDQSSMRTVIVALDIFRLDYGRYPTALEGLEILLLQNSNSGQVYLEEIPIDKWGNPIHYHIYTNTNTNTSAKEVITIWTFGKDGVYGGDGENKDNFYHIYRQLKGT